MLRYIKKTDRLSKFAKEAGYIMHEHICEYEFLYGNKERRRCCPIDGRPLKDECDDCSHFIIIDLDDKNGIPEIIGITRQNKNSY